MPDIFEKCDDFLERMERMAGDNFDALSEVFYRVYPIANSAPHIQFRGREVLDSVITLLDPTGNRWG